MTCRCDALEARIAALESRLGIASRQPSLFELPAPVTSGAPKYQAAFEEVWERTGRHGSKLPAWRTWERVGRPPWSAIAPGWTAYMRSDAPVRLGAVKHLSTWLNERGWQQEWQPAGPARRVEPAKTTGPTYAAPTTDCFPHGENPRCHTKRITPGCPRCKEQEAREAGRTMGEDEMLQGPPWMEAAK